jgi:hypothetical protein
MVRLHNTCVYAGTVASVLERWAESKHRTRLAAAMVVDTRALERLKPTHAVLLHESPTSRQQLSTGPG